MQLWPKKRIVLIPSSIAICERGFSTQNTIQSHLRKKLNLKTLDALMRISLCGLEVGCNGLGYHLQHLEKYARLKDTYTQLIVFLLQIKNLVF